MLALLLALAGPFDAIHDYVHAQLIEQQVPSISIAVAKGDKILWEESFGYADRERQILATPDTSYSLASISKPITGTALFTLVKTGKLDLDKPINDYLGAAKLRARIGDAGAATVRRVANHSAGLPEHFQFFYENEPWRVPSADETILRFGNLFAPPGERFEYSNLGYGVLSSLISRLSGKTFGGYLRQEVFLPLGMTHSSLEPMPFQAVRYGVDGLPIPWYETDHEGASAIFASAHDLVRFGQFNAKAHLRDQKAILSDAELDALHAPTMDEGNGKGYGAGWETSSGSGYTTLAHTGGMPGVATELRVVPAEKLVVVVLCNSEAYQLTHEIADRIMASQLPRFKPERRMPPGQYDAFAPPKELLGTWKGRVSTYSGDIPFIITIPETGDVHVKLGEKLTALLNRAHLSKAGQLRGIFTGNLGLEEELRRPHILGLNLNLRGNVLNGEITTRADNAGVEPTHGLFPPVGGHAAPARVQTESYILAQWVELTKQ
ncbi:MAG TPA: serine hydrolase domain-containing protein [Myxococcales bacterium]|jgi:CubicO group peptidase (beta-lactamase class C family)|nr:serine hydrolase domain-containing protein [Myxococcales bacterium]